MNFRILSYCCWVVLTAVVARADDHAASTKPNFLFIFADDQSYDTIAHYGRQDVVTPNLDRLASRGVSFLNAYNMGGWNGAICIASRTMMFTGRSVWRARKIDRQLDQLVENGATWPQLLQQAGYVTYGTGKWHINMDPNAVFDRFVHERPGMPVDSWTRQAPGVAKVTPEFVASLSGYRRPLEGRPDAWSPYERSFGGFWEGGKHWSEVLADDAVGFLQDAAQRDDPFFMYLAFNAPHDPRQAPKRFVDLYPLEEIAVPASYQPRYPYHEEMGASALLRDEALAPFPRTEHAVRVHRQEYFAIITHMDEQIGVILDALEATGKKDNTYIIFSADHGLACGNHGLLGKQNMYEHSMKAPLIVVGPDVPQNEQREALVYLQDIMATTLDLADVSPPAYVEFNSLVPLMQDQEASSSYDAIYGSYLDDAQRMIRVGDLKLIVYPRAQRVRLFNLKSDPHEIHDLSGEPAHWSTIQRLFAVLLDQQQEKGDALKLADLFPELLVSSDARSAWQNLVRSGVFLHPGNQVAFDFVEHEAHLPNVLLYGDSISIGYTATVREVLAGEANVFRLHRNGGSSSQFIPFMEELRQGMRDERLTDPWDFPWDIIHFNVGLHDLKYVADGELNKADGTQVTPLPSYAENLRRIISYLQEVAPRAKLVFGTTTPVPEGEPGRHAGDAAAYNQVAVEVLAEFPDVIVNDLYAFTKPHQTGWWTEPGNVHFNELGRTKQGERVAEVLRANL